MNKNEIVNTLQKELERTQKELLLLQKIEKIDLTKFDNKQLTKRLETHLKKSLGEGFYVTLSRDLSWNYKLSIIQSSQPYNYEYTPKINISIYDFKENNFKNDVFIEEVKKWSTSKLSTIRTLTEEIEMIDDAIKLYNDLIDLEEKASKELSYKFKEILDFHNKNYRRKIEA